MIRGFFQRPKGGTDVEGVDDPRLMRQVGTPFITVVFDHSVQPLAAERAYDLKCRPSLGAAHCRFLLGTLPGGMEANIDLASTFHYMCRRKRNSSVLRLLSAGYVNTPLAGAAQFVHSNPPNANRAGPLSDFSGRKNTSISWPQCSDALSSGAFCWRLRQRTSAWASGLGHPWR